MRVNRSWVLASRPVSAVRIDNFAYHEEVFIRPELREGEILVGTRIISCALTIRNWLNPPEHSYCGAMALANLSRACRRAKCLNRVMRVSHQGNGSQPLLRGRPFRFSAQTKLPWS